MNRAVQYPEAYENSVFRKAFIGKFKDAVSSAFDIGRSFKAATSKPNLGGRLAIRIVLEESL